MGKGKGIVPALLAVTHIVYNLGAEPAIIENPRDRAALAGRLVRFAVAAQGAAPLHYQWQFNGQDLPHATGSSLSLIATPTRAGEYAVRVFDGTGEQQSAPAKLEVFRRPVVVHQPANTVVGVHNTATLVTRLNDSGPYSRVIWHNYNPSEGPHEIPDTLGFAVDQPTLEIPNCLQNDSYNGLYWIAVTNRVAGTVSRRAKLTVVGPPVFTAEPQDRTVGPGSRVAFSVRLAPDAAGRKTFQWYKDGNPIAGATFSRLTLNSVQPEQAGNYYCMATSIGGSAHSWGAQLTVVTTP